MRHLYLLLFIACANVLLAQGRFATVIITETKLTDNIYMLEGSGGNIGLYIGEKETFMIDDQYAPLSEKIMAKIAELTDKPVTKLVNTHWHGDHSGGNENFGKKGAMIIAHENVYQRMSTSGTDEKPTPAISLPVITYDGSMNLRMLGEPVMLSHMHNAHTDGDSFVYFPESNVLHMGDCFFHKRFPYIDLDSGGSLDGVIAATEAAAMIVDDETQIIPGHGPMATKADLLENHKFLLTLKERVTKAINDGVTAEELDNDAMVAGYEDWKWAFINAERIAQTAYKSLSSK